MTVIVGLNTLLVSASVTPIPDLVALIATLGNNGIVLWGAGESVSVKELGAMLRTLNSDVRVVTLMSQCYSGGFAQLETARSGDGLPNGETCGFFSSTADRPA